MAKVATDEPAGMEKTEIKRHLRMARDTPVSVAFALAGDGKAIIQLDRRKPGRALEKQLKDSAPDSKSHRWGTALIDPDDAKTIRFTVNKAGGGLARKLIKALKGTGFSKVKILLDDGTELEAHEEEEEGGEDGEAEAEFRGPAADVEAAGEASGKAAADLAPEAHADSPAEPAAPAAPQPAAAQFDAAALAKDLTGLVKRMLGVISHDGTQKAALSELATDAQVSLKRGDLEQASAAIDIFREAIQDGEAAIAAGGAKPAAPNGAATKAAPPNGAEATPAAPAADTGNGAHAGAKHHRGTNGAAKPNGAATPEPDLRKEAEEILAALSSAVKQALPMVSMVPGLGEMIKTVVPAVKAAVKAGEHQQAQSGLQQILNEVLKGAGAGAGHGAGGNGPAANGAGAQMGALGGQAAHPSHAHQHHQQHAAKHAPAIEKASSVWGATRDRVMGEVQKLEKAFTSALDGHGMAEDLTKSLRTKVEDTLQHLDDRLLHALAAVNKAGDAAERAKHVEHAHKLVQHYQKHVSGDKTIKMLDSNPFLPLGIEKTVMASLAALQKTIR